MFEVDAESGFSTSELKMPVGRVDEVMRPVISKDHKESQNRENRAYPAHGFKLKVALRYDNSFSLKFNPDSIPGQEEIKYLLIFSFYSN